MGLEDENGPPKKKLKQAQLSFGNVAVKSQKRKLSPDLNEDVHANKIVCKETEKENVEINSKSSCGFSDSRKKLEFDSISHNSPEKHNTSKSEKHLSIDLTDDAISTPQNKEVEPIIVKEDDKSLKDFSLVISDSVLNSINCKSVGGKSNLGNDNSTVEESSDLKDNSLNGIGNKELVSDSGKEDPADTSLPLDESLNRTLNSEDDDFTVSSEESPKTISPGNVSRKLTPKRLESLKRKEERERLRLERKALRTKAKEEKLKLKQEREDLKRKEREEKEKKRQAELKIKEEEKRLKEEERKKKEEEKKLKDEEKKQKEEERRRKEEAKEEEKRKKEEMTEKEKAAFVNFFIAKKKQSDATDKLKESEEIKFMPFPMKSDMRLAVNPRRIISSEEKGNLDTALSGTHEKFQDLYLKQLKTGTHLPQKTDATWPVVSQEEEHDVIIVESTANGECIDLTNSKLIDNKKKMKAKLLQFHDNRRPPYWGTWRKRSNAVRPRQPLGQDKNTFDYEVDSDSEWEDEVEGEDIDKAGDSDEEQGEEEDNQNSGENGYLLDNTFVPHGYLSDEEVHPDEEVDDNDPENLKLRMKLLKQEFDEEMKSKTERLKPRLLGCVWISNGTTEVSTGSLYETLLRFRAVWNEDGGSIETFGPEIEDHSPTSLLQTKCKPFPIAVAPALVKFIHGNNLPLSGLVREFLLIIEKDYPSENISKRAVSLKIKEIATKTFDSSGKSVWAVNMDLCKEYGLKVINNSKCSVPTPVVPDKPKESLLVNFLKGTHTPQPVKKRVALISVPPAEGTPTPKEKSVHVSTPRPTVANVIKKRAQLITLSRTPDTMNTVSSVHKDTPRPSHAPSNLNLDTVDLSLDSS